MKSPLLNNIVWRCNPWKKRNSQASAIQLKSGRLLLAWRHWATGSDENQSCAEIRAKISEDHSTTWSNSFFWHGRRGHYRQFRDPALPLLASGKLGFCYWVRPAEKHIAGRGDNANQAVLMTIRNLTDQAFKSYPSDGGATWSMPEPTLLASSGSPIIIRRIPEIDDLLTIWNQASIDEIRSGYVRHRLSAAISNDKGPVRSHFRNLKSQDTCTYIEPEPVGGVIEREPGIRFINRPQQVFALTGSPPAAPPASRCTTSPRSPTLQFTDAAVVATTAVNERDQENTGPNADIVDVHDKPCRMDGGVPYHLHRSGKGFFCRSNQTWQAKGSL